MIVYSIGDIIGLIFFSLIMVLIIGGVIIGYGVLLIERIKDWFATTTHRINKE